MALEQIISHYQVDPMECYFWRTHGDAELDLLLFLKGKRMGFEFKFSDAPDVTKSMHVAVNDLGLDQLIVIYPGTKKYILSDKIVVQGLESYLRSYPKIL